MSLDFMIENDRLILKSVDPSCQREAPPEEFMAFQFGIKKGHELVASEIKKKIMALKVECYPEYPLAHRREEREWRETEEEANQ